MSLTLTLLTLDPSILPVVIHGFFLLFLLRRLFFKKILPIFFFANFTVKMDKLSPILSRKSSRDCTRVDVSMDSRSDCDEVQETEADEAEVESRKRQSLRKNSAFGSSASVQAKMSLDLIVEQLKREMSLKDIEAVRKDDAAKIKVQDDTVVESIARKDSTEREYSCVSENELNVKSENLAGEEPKGEALERKCDFEDTEKSLKEMSRCVAETTDLNVKDDISKNFEENVEENEIKDLHQRETTISSREPVDKVYGTEEENLYGLIRSMIAAEVKRYEERERTVVRKVHSDTTDVAGRRTKKRKLSLLNNENSEEIEKESDDVNSIKISKGLELEERNSPVGSIKSKVTVNHHLPRKENDAASVGTSMAFVLERKHDLRKSFGCRVEGKRINEEEKKSCERKVDKTAVPSRASFEYTIKASFLLQSLSTSEEKEVSTDREIPRNRETQTEREYTIRTVRSCPVRRRRRGGRGGAGGGTRGVLLDVQHHRCGLTGWIYRKASDNLIYEKGKASGSPSYVPLTQRFRWKYVQPRKAR